MKDVKILHAPSAAEPFVVIYKPRGLPSAPLKQSETENALFKTAQIFPEILRVSGRKEIECGLLHRLDTATEGLLLLATNQVWYEKLLDAQKSGLFKKEYYAKCFKKISINDSEGFPPLPRDLFDNAKMLQPPYTLESYFRAYGKGARLVRPVTIDSGKTILKKSNKRLYKTTIQSLEKADNDFYLVKILLRQLLLLNLHYRVQLFFLYWKYFPLLK